MLRDSETETENNEKLISRQLDYNNSRDGYIPKEAAFSSLPIDLFHPESSSSLENGMNSGEKRKMKHRLIRHTPEE